MDIPAFGGGCWACSAAARPCHGSAPEEAGRGAAAVPSSGGLATPGTALRALCVTARPVPCHQDLPPSSQTRHRGGRLASKACGSSPERGPASGSARARAALQGASRDPARAGGVLWAVLRIFVTALSCLCASAVAVGLYVSGPLTYSQF